MTTQVATAPVDRRLYPSPSGPAFESALRSLCLKAKADGFRYDLAHPLPGEDPRRWLLIALPPASPAHTLDLAQQLLHAAKASGTEFVRVYVNIHLDAVALCCAPCPWGPAVQWTFHDSDFIAPASLIPLHDDNDDNDDNDEDDNCPTCDGTGTSWDGVCECLACGGTGH